MDDRSEYVPPDVVALCHLKEVNMGVEPVTLAAVAVRTCATVADPVMVAEPIAGTGQLSAAKPAGLLLNRLLLRLPSRLFAVVKKFARYELFPEPSSQK